MPLQPEQSNPSRPPQDHSVGGRQALDAEWLLYLGSGGDRGDGETLRERPAFRDALTLLEQEHFYAAHEGFENAWGATRYPERLFCLALAKLSAGLEHERRGNNTGAHRVLGAASTYLRPFTPTYAGTDVRRLIALTKASKSDPG